MTVKTDLTPDAVSNFTWISFRADNEIIAFLKKRLGRKAPRGKKGKLCRRIFHDGMRVFMETES